MNALHLVELQRRVKQFCLSLGHISVFKNGYLFMQKGRESQKDLPHVEAATAW